MFAHRSSQPLDFADTRFDPVFTRPNFARLDKDVDPLDQIAQADTADLRLLRLVVCAALATLVMAVASSL